MSMPNSKQVNKEQQEQIQRIGLFGGTFDPIHNGHINSAKHLAHWLALDKISIIPSHIPPHKNNTEVSALHRENMVKLVCQQQPLFTLDNRELNKKSTSYTVETLIEIKQQQPNSRLFFLIGMDSLQSFTTWHRWQDILQLTHLVVSSRPGYLLTENNQATTDLLTQYQVTDLAKTHQQQAGCILLAPISDHDISSTQIRAQLKKQASIKDLLPETVSNYINRYKLYQ